MKVIQPGFADSDNLVALREFAKLVDTGFLHILVVGVNTGATKYMLVSANALVHRFKRLKVDPDAKHAGNCLLLDGFQQLIEIVIEAGQVNAIEVAV